MEKKVAITDNYPRDATTIYDGMAVLQKFKPPIGATFAVVADKLFAVVTSNSSKRIDVVFDVYKAISIKRWKRANGSVAITYHQILPGYQVKNWSKLLMSAQPTRWNQCGFL